MAETEKPFWLSPPYAILFDLLRLHRIRPWDVNIASLLTLFLSEIKSRGFIDFSASGTALLSSAIIHRMKTEIVLEMEEPPKPPPPPRPDEVVPPPLPLPLRFEYTSTSIEEVLRALEETLRAEAQARLQKKFILQPPTVIEQLDEFLTNIEGHIINFFSVLTGLARKQYPLSFLKIIKKLDHVEAVRRFIMLLFLAADGRVRVEQTVEFGDITIYLTGVETPAAGS